MDITSDKKREKERARHGAWVMACGSASSFDPQRAKPVLRNARSIFLLFHLFLHVYIFPSFLYPYLCLFFFFLLLLLLLSLFPFLFFFLLFPFLFSFSVSFLFSSPSYFSHLFLSASLLYIPLVLVAHRSTVNLLFPDSIGRRHEALQSWLEPDQMCSRRGIL